MLSRRESLIAGAGVASTIVAAWLASNVTRDLEPGPHPLAPQADHVTISTDAQALEPWPTQTPARPASDEPEVELSAALEQEVLALEAENTRLEMESDNRLYGFDQRQLEWMAARCEVRADQALRLHLLAPDIWPKPLEWIGADASEADAIEQTIRQFAADEHVRQRALLTEIGAEAPEFQPDEELVDLIAVVEAENRWLDQLADADDNPELTWSGMLEQVSHERAGLREPASASELASQTAYARYLYGMFTEGDRFAASLSTRLGEDRVHELRSTLGGWGGGRSAAGCPPARD